MKLPLLLSVPHAGLEVPDEAKPYCRLSRAEIVRDGDEGAAEIYDLRGEVERFVTTSVARAIVDVNRAPDDRRADGVVKTHTCWNVAVYDPFPPEEVVRRLLDRYYHPYHARLEREFDEQRLLLGVDCHTMAEIGPPIAPDTGQRRPAVCLSDAEGTTLPSGWIERLAACFRREFDGDVAINHPFGGGFITRQHGRAHPWVQLELSRTSRWSCVEKRQGVRSALATFCRELRPAG